MTEQFKIWGSTNAYFSSPPFGLIFYFKSASTFSADFYLAIKNKYIEKKSLPSAALSNRKPEFRVLQTNTDTADKHLHQQTSCLKCSFTPFLQGSGEYKETNAIHGIN